MNDALDGSAYTIPASWAPNMPAAHFWWPVRVLCPVIASGSMAPASYRSFMYSRYALKPSVAYHILSSPFS